MATFNVYMAGVGGQGIGLLSEILLRTADHAGLVVKSVDTHGLAQRGGIVVSQLRIGPEAYTPMISAHDADLVVALERHEALRAADAALKPGGVLIYYDAVWQPLPVRLGESQEVTGLAVEARCAARRGRVVRVFDPDLKDARMQNIAVLARIQALGLIPGIALEAYRQAMEDLMDGQMLTKNMAFFEYQRLKA